MLHDHGVPASQRVDQMQFGVISLLDNVYVHAATSIGGGDFDGAVRGVGKGGDAH